MTVLVVLVLAIGTGVSIALVVPAHVDLELDVAAEPPQRSVRVQAQWFWFTWRSGRDRRARAERVPRPRSRTHAAGRRRRRLLAAIRTRGFPGRTGRLAVEVLRALAPRTMDGYVRFGFEDPVSTGVLFGAAHAAAGLTEATASTLRLEPDFAGPALAGHARFVWTVRPGAVLWPVGTFAASPVTWRAALAALRAR